ncbi:MAG TPA: hypothetical protein VFE98_02845 [Candidatus Bathyarchaeia archaeon]|nr:hypothetical protein [Candidatus Bathyarchaeia archaeon]
MIVVVTGILLIGSVQAITSLQIPQTVIPAPSAGTTVPCCGSLVLNGAPIAGTLRYDCGGGPRVAGFTVTTGGTDTATFNLPPDINSVGYVPHSATSCTGFTGLVSGQAVTLATGAYDICASYSSCPSGCTIEAWTFQWLS